MKTYSQRRIFTIFMTILATLSGTVYGLYELHSHPDLIADLVKISVLLAVTSAVVSYGVWTVIHLKKESVLRGALAGLLTGLLIVPAPYFTSGLKTEVLRLHSVGNQNLLLSIFEALPLSLVRGLETFQIISKVSLIAVIASAALGFIIAKTVPARSGDKKSILPEIQNTLRDRPV